MASKGEGQRKEPLFERRARVQQQLERQRADLAIQWEGLERTAHAHERRIVGFSRGFRAVLGVGALAGGAWLVKRYGPARLARPVLLGLSSWNTIRRVLPFRNFSMHRNTHEHSAATGRWLPIAIAVFNGIRRYRDTHQRRQDVARAREKAYRRGRRDGRLRRQS